MQNKYNFIEMLKGTSIYTNLTEFELQIESIPTNSSYEWFKW